MFAAIRFCLRLWPVFDGTPTQLHMLIATPAALPDDTQVYCTHEYTGQTALCPPSELDNAVLLARCAADEALRAQGLPTVPTTIGLERQTNPVLRVNQPAVRASWLRNWAKRPPMRWRRSPPLREWKPLLNANECATQASAAQAAICRQCAND